MHSNAYDLVNLVAKVLCEIVLESIINIYFTKYAKFFSLTKVNSIYSKCIFCPPQTFMNTQKNFCFCNTIGNFKLKNNDQPNSHSTHQLVWNF